MHARVSLNIQAIFWLIFISVSCEVHRTWTIWTIFLPLPLQGFMVMDFFVDFESRAKQNEHEHCFTVLFQYGHKKNHKTYNITAHTDPILILFDLLYS